MEWWNNGAGRILFLPAFMGSSANIPVFQQSSIPLFEWAAVKHEWFIRASKHWESGFEKGARIVCIDDRAFVLHPLAQRQVDLQIVTGTGYTVYDSEEKVAFVQVQRGADNVTLHGMRILIDFGGTTYSTTVFEPNPNSVKSYFFDVKTMPTMPRTVSVAPVFILDARQVLGEVWSISS